MVCFHRIAVAMTSCDKIFERFDVPKVKLEQGFWAPIISGICLNDHWLNLSIISDAFPVSTKRNLTNFFNR